MGRSVESRWKFHPVQWLEMPQPTPILDNKMLTYRHKHQCSRGVNEPFCSQTLLETFVCLGKVICLTDSIP